MVSLSAGKVVRNTRMPSNAHGQLDAAEIGEIIEPH